MRGGGSGGQIERGLACAFQRLQRRSAPIGEPQTAVLRDHQAGLKNIDVVECGRETIGLIGVGRKRLYLALELVKRRAAVGPRGEDTQDRQFELHSVLGEKMRRSDS